MQLSVELLPFFFSLVIMNYAAMNIGVHPFVCLLLPGYTPLFK